MHSFSILKKLKPYAYIILAFSLIWDPSHALFLLFQQYKAPAVP